jgi:hypothetical protein
MVLICNIKDVRIARVDIEKGMEKAADICAVSRSVAFHSVGVDS